MKGSLRAGPVPHLVLVLAHHTRLSIELGGGTPIHFIDRRLPRRWR